jgi:hypothetical protein
LLADDGAKPQAWQRHVEDFATEEVNKVVPRRVPELLKTNRSGAR